jgi:phosphonate degradation associated HDIG domain protein
MTMTSVVDDIVALFETRGHAAYFGEPVSQKEHALQAAHFASLDNLSDSLVVAALLHDVGHLVHGLDEDIAKRGHDARHEEAGQAWLAAYFGPEITEPIKLHVAAKRYLCAVEPAYTGALSPASQLSLKLQGGPMSRQESAGFEGRPYFHEAVQLRRCDDRAKIPNLVVPGLDDYRVRLQRALKAP